MKLKHYIHNLIVLVVLSLGLGSAQAATVYEETRTVFGSTASTTTISLASAGTYQAILEDSASPEAFAFLLLGLTQEDGSSLGALFGGGSFTFTLPSPGKVLAHLSAITGAGGTGEYGIEISAIPLPPALLLFTSALFGLVIVGRRERTSGAA